jgi:urease subunit alpha
VHLPGERRRATVGVEPERQHAVTPGLDVGPATDAISGEQLILTAGGIDTHVHYVAPQEA